jgi:Trypsin-like peptidase domain
MKRPCALSLLSLLFAVFALAGSMPGAWGVSKSQPRAFGAPPLRSAKTAASIVARLDATTEADLAALRSHNAATNGPARIGVVHRLAEPVTASRGVSASAGEPFRWRGAVHVASGHRLRLELTGVNAPSDARFWVYGSTGEAIGFDLALAWQGTMWTPSVEGDTITIEVETRGATAPLTNAAAAPFTIAAVADLRPPAEVMPADDSCIGDAKCYASADELASSIAYMEYMSGNGAYICSGGLIIDAAKSFTPYFLTANHCIGNGAEAASLETYWDFKTSTCNGVGTKSGKPRVNGSVLLATSAASDVSLLRLSGMPSGGSRYFLGWTTAAQEAGTMLYRVSHPLGQPQRYSTTTVTTSGGTCTGWRRPEYLYQTRATGATAPGSSGSPVVTSDGRIVGQLSGACGPDPDDACNNLNRTVDGAFASSYALLKPILNPETTTCSACVPNANTACAMDGRFKITMTWRDSGANLQGNGSLITYADNRPETNPQYGTMSQTVFFSMYQFAPNSIELMVRMLRGVNVNDKFWVFMTGFSPNDYTVTVTDTQKCTTWTRTNERGNFSIVADYNAFPF